MKRILAIFMCVLMFAGTGITAHAEHYIPNNPDREICNNTICHWDDATRLHSYTKTHGYSCTVTCYVYSHRKYCSSCGAYLGEGPTYQCTEVHTCGSYLKDCAGQH